MKITEQKLKALIREAVKKKLNENKTLAEGSDYTAGRQVILSAQQAAFDFEQEILKNLDLVQPDDLPPELRVKFNDVVETMKDDIVSAVKNAVDRLAPFPRASQQGQDPLAGRPGQ